jgi:two-component system, cell cycle sensor histidine kinase and response regulator CckA
VHGPLPGQYEATSIVGELKALERRYEALFGLNPDLLLACDTDGRLVGCNTAFEMLAAVPARELLGQPLLSFVAPEDRDRARRHFRRAVAGDAQNFEITATAADGRDFTLAMTLAPTLLDGAVDGVHGVARDVSRPREAERALRDVEERYNLLAENVQDMISLHDAAGAFIYASPSAWRLLGYHPVELIGRSVYDLVEPDDRAIMRTAHETIMRREGRGPATVRGRRRDGSIGWFETTARMVTAEDTGEPWRIIAVTRDVTERRQFEQQLLQSQKMEAVGRLAGGVAHDFNNALTVITGHAELLIQQLDDAQVREGAEHIREAALRASALARQLLSLERSGDGEKEFIDVNAVLLGLQSLVARVLDARVTLTLELAPELQPIYCATAALEQITMNLVVNARDAMPQGGRLLIRTENVRLGADERPTLDGGDYVLVTIADTGVGMEDNVATRIFEPFFTTRSEQGSGLGLSMVYNIVRQAQGDVMVETAPGRGTAFRIYLPARSDAPLPPPEPQLPDAPGGTETILVAEDDNAVRALITATLQRYGYNVMTAVDGRQGLDLFHTYGHVVDLIVTDVNMPDMTGAELVRAIRQSGSQLPVLFTSGFSAESLPLADLPQWTFLPKPFTPLELARAVRTALPDADADA